MNDDKKEKREATIQYLKIITQSLWLIMTVVGIVIAVKYAQVMDHVSSMMQHTAEAMSEAADSSDYDSSDYSSDYGE